MPRARSLVVALAPLACACATAGRAPAEVAPSRVPDGVVADLPFHAPAASPRATADGVITLAAPVDRAEALEVVAALFAAISAQDEAKLAALALPSATFVSRPRGPASSFVDHWRARLRKLSYRALDAGFAARAQVSRHDEVPPEARPNELAPFDLFVHIPTRPSSGGERLFGDAVDLVLRPTPEGLLLRAQLEEFTLP